MWRMPPLRTGINGNPGITTDWRSLTVAKITAVNTPTSGPFEDRPVYSWIEQTFDPETGECADSPTPRKGTYTSATVFENVLLDLNDAPLAVDSYVWCRIKGQVYGTTVYECDKGGTNKVYYVKLTGFGAGVDGGIAWAGLIQIEDGGLVIDNGYIGGDNGSGVGNYVMYPCDAEDGSAGNPEVGDTVVAIPDPSKSGVWIFQPKRGTGPDDCGTCGWLSDLKITSCLYVYMRGGFGRCSCITTDCWNCEQDPESDCQPTPMIWVASENAWLSLGMKDTCCGCGQVYFRITDEENEQAQVQMADVHISCESSSGGQQLVTITLKQECCGVNRCGRRYVLFRGKGTAACDGEEEDCGNEFYVMIECAPCPPLDCSCCCIEESPPAYYQNFTSGLFVGGGNEEMNGRWVWRKNNTDPDRPCYWLAECSPTGKSSSLEREGDYFVLRHDTFVYRLAAADWDCSGTNTLTYVSGGSGSYPGTVVLNPMLPLDFDTEAPDPLACTPPDEVTIEIVSADCPILNTTQALTRLGPSSNAWGWTNPVIIGDRITVIQLACVEGQWAVSASAVCDGEPSPWGLATNSRPDTQEFDPFELVWNSVDIGGLDPSPTPYCCNIGTAVVTVTE